MLDSRIHVFWQGSKWYCSELLQALRTFLQSEWVKRTGIPIESSKQQDKSQLGRHTDVNALANDVREQEKDIAKRRKEISARLDELQPIRIRHKDRQETVLAAQQKLDREMKTFSGDLENMEKVKQVNSSRAAHYRLTTVAVVGTCRPLKGVSWCCRSDFSFGEPPSWLGLAFVFNQVKP